MFTLGIVISHISDDRGFSLVGSLMDATCSEQCLAHSRDFTNSC